MISSPETAIRQAYVDLYPAEATRIIEACDDDELITETSGLPTQSISLILDRLSPSRAIYLFENLNRSIQLDLLTQLPPRLALKILLAFKVDFRTQILEQLPRDIKLELIRLLTFSDDSAVFLMDSAVCTIRADMNVRDALHQIRTKSRTRERSVFVVNDNGVVEGRVEMQDLALADENYSLSKLIRPIEFSARAATSRDAIAEILEECRDDTLPVTDDAGKLLGIVRHDVLINVVEDDAAADLQRMVGGSVEERVLSRPMDAVRLRLPWLYANLVTAFLACAMVAVFENLIATFTALAVLLPLVAGQSGNAGAQAMAVMIRGLALREISIRQWCQVAWKELLVGIANGVAIAIACGVAIYFWSQSLGLSIIIFASMIFAVAMAGVAGALVPSFLARFGQDPAMASSIILSTITDVVGFLSFLGIATSLSDLI